MEHFVLFKSVDSSFPYICQFFSNFIYYFLPFCIAHLVQGNQLHIYCLSCLTQVLFFLNIFPLFGIILDLHKCCMMAGVARDCFNDISNMLIKYSTLNIGVVTKRNCKWNSARKIIDHFGGDINCKYVTTCFMKDLEKVKMANSPFCLYGLWVLKAEWNCVLQFSGFSVFV